MARDPLHVLVVDDSAVVRQAMTSILESAAGARVTVAADPLIAMRKMAQSRPDVILLDLEMPRMDGLSFLRKLMAEDPIPVVVCSGLAGAGTHAALQAMDEGAVAVVAKPRLGIREFLEDSAILLEEALRGAAAARLRPRQAPGRGSEAEEPPTPRAVRPQRAARAGDRLVAIAASTGGTEALRTILESMPLDCPGIVVVQHMPEVFTRAFADRLNAGCRIEVKEAEPGDRVSEGRALDRAGQPPHDGGARGDGRLLGRRDGRAARLAPPAERRRAVPLGRGERRPERRRRDPHRHGRRRRRGSLEMHQAGAATLAQDEASSVVFGMPKEAIARGGVDEVVPLSEIARAMLRLAGHAKGAPA